MLITLDLRDLATIVSLLLAIDGYRRFSNERRAKKTGRHELMKQVAADVLSSLAKVATDLENAISRRDWEQCRDRANRLRLGLAEAVGSWSELLVPSEKDKTEAAVLEVRAVQAFLPLGAEANFTPEEMAQFLGKCSTVYTLLAEVAGKLRYAEEPELTFSMKVQKWLHIRNSYQEGNDV